MTTVIILKKTQTQLHLLAHDYVALITKWGTEPRAPNSKLRAVSIRKH